MPYAASLCLLLQLLGFPVQLVGLLALPYLGVRWFVDGQSAGKDIEEAVVGDSHAAAACAQPRLQKRRMSFECRHLGSELVLAMPCFAPLSCTGPAVHIQLCCVLEHHMFRGIQARK
jgi:hypothetical protein